MSRMTNRDAEWFFKIVELAREEGDPEGPANMKLDVFLDEHIKQIADELRGRRAADLKPEEVEALEFAYDRIQGLELSFGDRKWREMFPRMLATISRIIAARDRLLPKGVGR